MSGRTGELDITRDKVLGSSESLSNTKINQAGSFTARVRDSAISPRELKQNVTWVVDTVATVAQGGAAENLQELVPSDLGYSDYPTLTKQPVIYARGFYVDANGDPDGVFEGRPFQLVFDNTLSDNGGTIRRANALWDSESGAVDAFWVLQFSGAVNVKWFGAKGDGTTDDTTAITAAITKANTDVEVVYFPAATYMVNLSLTSVANTVRYDWKGDGKWKTILKAYDNTADCVQIIPASSITRCRFEGIQFDGNGSATKAAFQGDDIHYSVFSDCYFRNALFGFKSKSFGNRYESCFFGGDVYTQIADTSYGFCGVGTSSSYAGWHTFIDCQFQGGIIAYAMDNDKSSGSDAGSGGSVHIRSDFESVDGLSIFLRNVGNNRHPETFDHCWFEGNAASGTATLSSFPFASGSTTIASLTIPTSGIIIYDGGASSDKNNFVEFKGGCPGAYVYNDTRLKIDRYAHTGIEAVEVNTSADNVYIDCELFNGRQASGAGWIVNRHRTREVDIQSPEETNKPVIAKAYCHKHRIDHTVPNYYADIAIQDVSVPSISPGATIELITDDGLLFGRCYEVVLPDDGYILFPGTDTASRLTHANQKAYGSFAVRAEGADYELTPVLERNGVDEVDGNSIIAIAGAWETWNFTLNASLYKLKLYNRTGGNVTFRFCDFQHLNATGDFDREYIRSFVTNGGFAALKTTSDLSIGEKRNMRVTIPSASVLALNSTPYELIPAPGAGKFIQVDNAVVGVNYGGTAYAGANALEFRYTDGSGAKVLTDFASADLNTASDLQKIIQPTATNLAPVAAAAVVAYVPTANPTAGNSTVVVDIEYTIKENLF